MTFYILKLLITTENLDYNIYFDIGFSKTYITLCSAMLQAVLDFRTQCVPENVPKTREIDLYVVTGIPFPESCKVL
jgi:hypothetical protein